jgi:hypothetical protein
MLPNVNSTQRLRHYLNAIYAPAIAGAPALRIGRRAADLESRFPRAHWFALLTAWNPGSESCAAEVNLAAQCALDADLAAIDVSMLAAFNSDPAGGWKEVSRLLFDLAPERSDRLAQRYGQAAALCWPRGRAVRLRLYRPAWRADAVAARVDMRFIDWVACAGP